MWASLSADVGHRQPPHEKPTQQGPALAFSSGLSLGQALPLTFWSPRRRRCCCSARSVVLLWAFSASPVQQQLNVPQPNGRTRARHAGWQADEGEVKAESLRSGCELGALQRLLCAKNPARCANLCPVRTRCGSARLVALWALVGRVVGLVAAATLNFALANKPDEAKVTAG
jgi:hypothetical protein